MLYLIKATHKNRLMCCDRRFHIINAILKFDERLQRLRNNSVAATSMDNVPINMMNRFQHSFARMSMCTTEFNECLVYIASNYTYRVYTMCALFVIVYKV